MPTEDFLLDLDVDEIKRSLLDVLTYKSEHGLLLALVVIFEAFVVLVSLADGYTKASTEALRRIDREAANNVKKARDTIAHSYYSKSRIKSIIRYIYSTKTFY